MGEIANKGRALYQRLLPPLYEACGDKLASEFKDELAVPAPGGKKTTIPHSDPTPPWMRTGDLVGSIRKQVMADCVEVYSDESIAPYAKYLEAAHPWVLPVAMKADTLLLPVIQKVIDSQ